VARVALSFREDLKRLAAIARRRRAVALLAGVTTSPTHWRWPVTGLALVLAMGAACATDAALPAAGPALTPSTTAPPATDERAGAHAEFKRLYDAGEYSAAVEQGRRVVELTERAGAQPEELQVALMNLASAQLRAGDLVAAEAGFQRVIGLIEAAGRLTSPRLARAYAGLGLTYHAARRYDLAAVSLQRAISLNRRAEGLFNEEQLPLLDKQADALTELGRVEDALLAQRYALRVVRRNQGERSLAFARQLESLGRWYTRARAFEAGRSALRQSAELVQSLAGPGSTELVGPLTGFAENARRWLTDPMIRDMNSADTQRASVFQDPAIAAPPGLSPSTIATEGLRALERAATIVDANPDSAPALVADVHSQLGDWHTARQLPERAKPSYQRAWQAAGAASDGAKLQQALFGAPLLIRYTLPENWDRYARRPPAEVERRDVELELTVTADGGVRDPRVVSGGSDQRLAGQALRAVETARYRPRLADGQPVETPAVRFVQSFYVLREDTPGDTPAATPAQPAAEDAPTAPPPAAQGGG
jgi:tetratricopeptide (TPR) repeat protein